MNKDISTTDFTSRLNTERNALRLFVKLLETEQQTLISGDAELLLTLSDSKVKAVNELARLANERKIDMLGFDESIEATDIAAWLKLRAPSSQSTWAEIQQLAEQMQYLNRSNGTLIQSKLLHNQQALAVLHNATNSTHSLYGANGQSQHTSSGRILGSV